MIDRETLYEKISDAINISEDMFDYAEAEYKKIAKWIEANSKNYDIIYKKGKQLGGQRHGQSNEGIGRRAL